MHNWFVTCSVKSLTRVSWFDYLPRITALQWLVIAYRTRVYNSRESRGPLHRSRLRSHARNLAMLSLSLAMCWITSLSRELILFSERAFSKMSTNMSRRSNLQMSTFLISGKVSPSSRRRKKCRSFGLSPSKSLIPKEKQSLLSGWNMCPFHYRMCSYHNVM